MERKTVAANARAHGPAPPALLRLGPRLTEAIHEIIEFTRRTTGIEPSQGEIAGALKSYFTLAEMANQLAYLHRRPEAAQEEPRQALFVPRMRIDLKGGPAANSLARAGFFRREVAEGLLAIRRHAASALGRAPGEAAIAAGLKSSFILSEIKNQILHLRSLRK
ncbi:MAG: hypothetical protein WHT06_17085 [Desulfobacterales bacterium]